MKPLPICLLFIPLWGLAETTPYRDPTTPLTPTTPTYVATDDELMLQAIFISAHRAEAIINNTPLQLHQVINGYELIVINREDVQLKGENGIVTLALVKQAVKKN